MNAEQYVFVSYAHKNSDIILPCVEAMKKSGINLWYDEGIQAGSEWPEYIAERVASCSKFILFISNAYLDSQNCKRELNFAISRKKDILSVFIEDVELSLGIEMQLGTYQSIFKNRFPDNYTFYNSLCNEAWFDECRIGYQGGSSNNYSQPQKTVEFTQNASYVSKQPKKHFSTPKQKANKNRLATALLAIFLGGIGLHHFYFGKWLRGVLCILFLWTYIPSIVGFIEGLVMLFMSDEKFAMKFKN